MLWFKQKIKVYLNSQHKGEDEGGDPWQYINTYNENQNKVLSHPSNIPYGWESKQFKDRYVTTVQIVISL